MKSALLALLLVAASAQAQMELDWSAALDEGALALKNAQYVKALEIDERTIADMLARLGAKSEPQFAVAVAQKAEALEGLGRGNDARMFRRLARHLGANVPNEDRPMVTKNPPLRVGGDVTAPVALKRASPRYAEGARKARIFGVVIVESIIDKNGVIRDAEVRKGLAPTLDYAAVDAVRQWRFIPGRLKGEVVSVLFDLTINFKLGADEDENMPRY